MLLASILASSSIACGGPAPGAAPVPPVAVTIPPDGGALPPADSGVLVERGEGVRLSDGTILIEREDRCVEVKGVPGCDAIDTGEVEVLADKWLVYRDIDHRFRVRELAPRGIEFRGGRATLAIGDRAKLGSVTIHWHGVARVEQSHEAIIEITIRDPSSTTPPKTERLTARRPSLHLLSPRSYAVLDLELESVNDDATEILLRASESDASAKASFGDALHDGSYVYPDGLRVTYRADHTCDYDTSVSCIWRYRVDASMDGAEKHIELTARAPAATVLGHSFKIVQEKLVVTR